MGSSCSRSSVCASQWISCGRDGEERYEDGDGERRQLSVARVVCELCVRDGRGRHPGARARRWRRAACGDAR